MSFYTCTRRLIKKSLLNKVFSATTQGKVMINFYKISLFASIFQISVNLKDGSHQRYVNYKDEGTR